MLWAASPAALGQHATFADLAVQIRFAPSLEALRQIRDQIKDHPDAYEVLTEILDLQLSAGDIREAERTVAEICSSGDASGLLHRLMKHVDDDKPLLLDPIARLIEHPNIRELVDEDANYTDEIREVKYELIKSYCRLGRFDSAERILQSNPDRKFVWLALKRIIRIYAEEEQVERGTPLIEKYIAAPDRHRFAHETALALIEYAGTDAVEEFLKHFPNQEVSAYLLARELDEAISSNDVSRTESLLREPEFQDVDGRADYLIEAAEMFLEEKETCKAVAMLKTVTQDYGLDPRRYDHNVCIRRLISALVDAGEDAWAIQWCRDISAHDEPYNWTESSYRGLSNAACQVSDKGHTERALAIARQIGEPINCAITLSCISRDIAVEHEEEAAMLCEEAFAVIRPH